MVELSGKVIGCGRVDIAPGLPGVYDLSGFIHEAFRQQGCGNLLLKVILKDLRSVKARRLSYAADTQGSTAYAFLQARGFQLEHLESTYDLEIGRKVAQFAALPAGCSISTLSKMKAVELFINLYDECFTGLPWYQPYGRAEVLDILANPENLLFLNKDSSPIGFSWIHPQTSGVSEIEPMGLTASNRNQGLGKHLLRASLEQLRQTGAARVQISAWQDNEAAVRLYTGLGFKHAADRFYLALDLQNKA